MRKLNVWLMKGFNSFKVICKRCFWHNSEILNDINWLVGNYFLNVKHVCNEIKHYKSNTNLPCLPIYVSKSVSQLKRVDLSVNTIRLITHHLLVFTS